MSFRLNWLKMYLDDVVHNNPKEKKLIRELKKEIEELERFEKGE